MKVGDYVRTPQGIITKIINIQKDTRQYFLNGNAVSLESKNYIADKNITIGENFKHSPNIIDLIEENDFIDGMRITQIISNKNGVLECMKDSDYEFITTITNNEVKSVLTHEQFESMEYRIGE